MGYTQITPEKVELLKTKYMGRTVHVDQCEDPCSDSAGLEGVVTFVDSMGIVNVEFFPNQREDQPKNLGLIYGIDTYHIVNMPEEKK